MLSATDSVQQARFLRDVGDLPVPVVAAESLGGLAVDEVAALDGRRSRSRSWTSVDLPAPEGPITPIASLWSAAKLMSVSVGLPGR